MTAALSGSDLRTLRELAKQYAELASGPEQDRRRALWTAHNSLEPARPPVKINFGMHNPWCRAIFGDQAMACADPLLRQHERALRMMLFHAELDDDTIFEPWLTVGARRNDGWGGLWGVQTERIPSGVEGGAWKYKPAIVDLDDIEKLRVPHHVVDEEATARDFEKLADAVGDILPIDVDRTPVCRSFAGDISTHIAHLRELEQLMIDMIENPEWLHRLLGFMRDGILTNQREGEQAGHYRLTSHANQAMSYCRELRPPTPDGEAVTRKDLWCFCAAQEYTAVSPAMHDEFLLQYQLPIISRWGLVAYGCCEDLTRKIDMLRQIPNLRRIAVTPSADVAKCAEQIGRDYVISWRPNPTNMVCYGFDEGRIRRIIRHGLEATRGCSREVLLKDVETVEGDPTRLRRWVAIVRDEVEAATA